ncbi:hypothetical protein RB653_002626 [Dictyostelium firmibasis]|uniref:Lipase n=1 Tax=Dictyostelium firmibasis TaxID=79012 RepID=A0AAN7TP65_9MYCE
MKFNYLISILFFTIINYCSFVNSIGIFKDIDIIYDHLKNDIKEIFIDGITPVNHVQYFIETVNFNGYPCEHHSVTTEDGYILGVFRIPYSYNENNSNNNNNNKTRQPILLQHGLLDSSITWIVNNANQSLPFILSDMGYDVWMGNNRGNTYSINHTRLDVKSREFWEFSFDDMGWYDLPSMVDYIIDTTGVQEVGYVGHSEGTMQAWISYSEIKGFDKKVPIYIGLGPVGNVSHITNVALKTMATYRVDDIFRIFGTKQFLPSPKLLRGLFISFCIDCPLCCEDVVEWLCGPHKGAFNQSRMPFVSGNEPGGTSLRNMVHFTQLVNSKRFQHYDYGVIGNLLHYGHEKPPLINVENIPPTVKIALFSGTKDELADTIDVKQLVSLLPQQSVLSWDIIESYAHLDYVWAIDAHILIYPKILNYFNDFFNQSQS